MNNLALKTRLSQMLGLARSGADGTEEYQQIQDVVNDAVIDILSRTRLYIRTVDLTLTAGEDEYDWGSSVLNIHNLRYMKSDGSSGDELVEVSPGDIAGSGSGTYAIMGYNRICLGWTPVASTDPTTLKLRGWYTPKPSAMVNDNDDPSTSTFGLIPVQFHAGALMNYGAWKLNDMAGGVAAESERYRTMYEGQRGDTPIGSDLGDIKYYINKRAGSGSQQGRRRKLTESISSDIDTAYWQG